MSNETVDNQLEGILSPASTLGMYRTKDPETSKLAAEALVEGGRLHNTKVRVMRAFEEHGAMCDKELETLPEMGLGVEFAYSSVRKRRTDLLQLGIVEAVGRNNFYVQTVWDLSGFGRELLAGDFEALKRLDRLVKAMKERERQARAMRAEIRRRLEELEWQD